MKGKPKKKDKLPARDEFSREDVESAKLMILEESMVSNQTQSTRLRIYDCCNPSSGCERAFRSLALGGVATRCRHSFHFPWEDFSEPGLGLCDGQEAPRAKVDVGSFKRVWSEVADDVVKAVSAQAILPVLEGNLKAI